MRRKRIGERTEKGREEQEGNGPIDFGRQGLRSYVLYDLDYLCSHVCLASKCSYWFDLARKCLIAAFQWWSPRLRTRPKRSVTSVVFQRPRRSIVNLLLWFSGLKLPLFELVRDRKMTPPILLPLRSLGYEPLTSCLRPK